MKTFNLFIARARGKAKQSIIAATIILTTGTLALNGCMMARMCGSMMRGASPPRAGEAPPGKGDRTVKEVMFGDYRIVADFPPLRQREKAVLSLRIHSLNDSMSTNAKVRMRITEGEKAGDEKVIFDDLLKFSEPGKYEHSFTPPGDGVYHLEFHVSLWDDETLKEPLVLSATQKVKAMQKTRRSGFRFTPLKIVGGVITGTAMLVMMILRGC